MIIDSREIEDGASFWTDVCVIGSGAAGLTFAKEILGTGREIFLMESGGHLTSPEADDLNVGTLEGEMFDYYQDYLLKERIRVYGGSTNIWEGVCLPLQEIDFEEREWMPNSAWPISKSDLDPYYARAANYLGIHGYDKSVSDDPSPIAPRMLPEETEWEGLAFHMSNQRRLGIQFEEELKNAENLKLHLHANAILFEGNENGSKIEAVEFATLEGRRFKVKANLFVLAAGGMENCRILLNSNADTDQNIGNQYDNLGRYFMDQFHTPGGRVVLPNPLDDHLSYDRALSESHGYIKMGALSLKQSAQRRHRISNQTLIFQETSKFKIDDERNRAVASSMPLFEKKSVRRRDTKTPFVYWFRLKSEVGATPDNRITLGEEKDALGVRRLHLCWKLSEDDRRMFARFTRMFGNALGEHFIGRLQEWYTENGKLSKHTKGHGHQLGGTRMHADPRKGVVDANCSVHGVTNFKILGGSVFPSGGNTNPTMTIMALAIRMADQFKKGVS
ncbi:GMC oxidoreductase [Puniceicoccaceae bacterium K14]|nr:GMC oxidoreductase [Puniceicoccaceae bacterium K14]